MAGRVLASFLNQLFDSGHIRLATAAPLVAAEGSAIDRLREEEQAARADFPGEAPAFLLDAGYWAAGILYRACQFYAARELPELAVRADLSTSCPGDLQHAGTHYSVDITLRYLPDLYRLAASRAHADPLVDALRSLGDAWPLSGIGIPANNAAARADNLAPILGCPGLKQLYVDRVLDTGNRSLPAHPELREAALASTGIHFPPPDARDATG